MANFIHGWYIVWGLSAYKVEIGHVPIYICKKIYIVCNYVGDLYQGTCVLNYINVRSELGRHASYKAGYNIYYAENIVIVATLKCQKISTAFHIISDLYTRWLT